MKGLRPLSLLTCIVLLLPVVQASGQSEAALRCGAPSVSSALDAGFMRLMELHQVPGAAVAVVADGEIRMLQGFGCADLASGRRVDPGTTVFRIASISKLFVAASVLQLAERGEIDLHADVNRYLTTFQVPPYRGGPITAHHLLTHTAGLEENVVGYAARTPADVRPLGEFLADQLPARGWAAGEVTGYSNFGYALAAYVVESVAERSFAEYVSEKLLLPLGMTSSSFRQPAPEELGGRMAVGYRCGDAECEPTQMDFRSGYPAGGMVSTAADMARFLEAQLDPQEHPEVLAPGTLSLMHTRQFTHDARLAGMAYGYAEDELRGYRALSHGGGIPGFSSLLVIVPERQFGVFIIANGGSTAFGRAALDTIAGTYLPPAAAGTSSATTGERLATGQAAGSTASPVGSYRLTRYPHHRIENLPSLFTGQLHVAEAAGDTVELIGAGEADGFYAPLGGDEWRRSDGEESFVLRRGDDSEISYLFVGQSFFGTRFPAAFERLAWYDSPTFVNEALSVLLLPLALSLLWLLFAAGAPIVRALRRSKAATLASSPGSARMRMAALMAAAASGLLAPVFAFGFLAPTVRAAEQGGNEIVYGMPPAMVLLGTIPLLLAILCALICVAAYLSWKEKWWSPGGRVCYTGVALSVCLVVLLLWRWSYIPAVY